MTWRACWQAITSADQHAKVFIANPNNSTGQTPYAPKYAIDRCIGTGPRARRGRIWTEAVPRVFRIGGADTLKFIRPKGPPASWCAGRFLEDPGSCKSPRIRLSARRAREGSSDVLQNNTVAGSTGQWNLTRRGRWPGSRTERHQQQDAEDLHPRGLGQEVLQGTSSGRLGLLRIRSGVVMRNFRFWVEVG